MTGKNYKRILAGFITAVMLIAMLPAGVAGAEESAPIEYVFSGPAIGFDTATGIAMVSGSAADNNGKDMDDVKPEKSAPWDLLAYRSCTGGYYRPEGISCNTTGTLGIAFSIKVEKPGTYVPTVHFDYAKTGVIVSVYMFDEAEKTSRGFNMSNQNGIKALVESDIKPIGSFDTDMKDADAIRFAEDEKGAKSFDPITLSEGTYYVVFSKSGEHSELDENTGDKDAKCIQLRGLTFTEAPEEDEITEEDVSFGVYQINGDNSDITVTAPGNVTVGSTAEAAVGTTVKAEAADMVDGKRFAYWRVGGSFYTEEKTLEYTLNTNASLVAVYEDEATVDNKTVEFWNENGQFLDSKEVADGSIEMPAAPSLTGYAFDDWYVNDTVKFVNSDIAAALTRVVAKYKRGENDTGIPVSGSIKVYADGSDTATQIITAPAYNTEITATAEAPAGKEFSHWTRDGEVVSYNSTYTFRAWGETEIKAVFTDEAAAKVPVIVLAKTKIGNAPMIEYEVPAGYTKMEAGIVFNNLGTPVSPTITSFTSKAEAKSTSSRGQFTAVGEKNDNVVRGYLIYKDNSDDKTYVIYAD